MQVVKKIHKINGREAPKMGKAKKNFVRHRSGVCLRPTGRKISYNKTSGGGEPPGVCESVLIKPKISSLDLIPIFEDSAIIVVDKLTKVKRCFPNILALIASLPKTIERGIELSNFEINKIDQIEAKYQRWYIYTFNGYRALIDKRANFWTRKEVFIKLDDDVLVVFKNIDIALNVITPDEALYWDDISDFDRIGKKLIGSFGEDYEILDYTEMRLLQNYFWETFTDRAIHAKAKHGYDVETSAYVIINRDVPIDIHSQSYAPVLDWMMREMLRLNYISKLPQKLAYSSTGV